MRAGRPRLLGPLTCASTVTIFILFVVINKLGKIDDKTRSTTAGGRSPHGSVPRRVRLDGAGGAARRGPGGGALASRVGGTAPRRTERGGRLARCGRCERASVRTRGVGGHRCTRRDQPV